MPHRNLDTQSTTLNMMLLPLASAIAYLGLDAEKLTILAALMMVDMATGTVKAFCAKDDITSRRFISGFLSKMVVLLIPFAVALMAKGVDFDIRWFVNFSISILIVAETYSIIGNVHTIKTGEVVREIDAVSAILKMVRGVFENLSRTK